MRQNKIDLRRLGVWMFGGLIASTIPGILNPPYTLTDIVFTEISVISLYLIIYGDENGERTDSE